MHSLYVLLQVFVLNPIRVDMTTNTTVSYDLAEYSGKGEVGREEADIKRGGGEGGGGSFKCEGACNLHFHHFPQLGQQESVSMNCHFSLQKCRGKDSMISCLETSVNAMYMCM